MRSSSWMSICTQINRPEIILQISFMIYAVLSLGSMATMSIGAGIAFLGFIYFQIFNTQKKHHFMLFSLREKKMKIYFIFSLLLALAILFSLLGTYFFPLTYSNVTPTVHWVKDLSKIWYLFWPLVLSQGMRSLDNNALKIVLKTWLITLGILAFIGIIQYFTGWPRPQLIPHMQNRYHATLFFGHHLSAVSILIFPFFACFQYALTASKKNEFKKYIGITFVTCITLFLSFSRTFWVAFPIGIVALLARLVSKKITFLIVILMIGLGFYFWQIPLIQNRMLDIVGMGAHKNQYALNTRVDLWKANYDFFQKRILTGAGFKKNHELSGPYLQEKLKAEHVFAGHAHNNFLDFLGGTGLFGALSWIGWCLCVLWLTFKKSQISIVNRIRYGLFCAWIVFHLNGMSQVNFLDGKVQHQIAWVIAWTLL